MASKLRLAQLDIVTVYDPARSRESEYKALARHAIGTFGMSHNYNVYVLDTWAKRCSLDEVLTELERQCAAWQPRCVGVESVAAQAAIADICYTWLSLNHLIAPLYTDLMPDTRLQKKWRIRMQLQRVAPFGRLYIQPHHYELRTELLALPNGRTIDLADILAYGIELLNPPMEHTTRSVDRFLERKRNLAAPTTQYESTDPLNPLSRVPRVRQPPSENAIRLRRAG